MEANTIRSSYTQRHPAIHGSDYFTLFIRTAASRYTWQRILYAYAIHTHTAASRYTCQQRQTAPIYTQRHTAIHVSSGKPLPLFLNFLISGCQAWPDDRFTFIATWARVQRASARSRSAAQPWPTSPRSRKRWRPSPAGRSHLPARGLPARRSGRLPARRSRRARRAPIYGPTSRAQCMPRASGSDPVRRRGIW